MPRWGQACFTAKAFAEVLDEIDPRLGAAVQTLQDRCTLRRNHADLVLANLATGPVQQLQVSGAPLDRRCPDPKARLEPEQVKPEDPLEVKL